MAGRPWPEEHKAELRKIASGEARDVADVHAKARERIDPSLTLPQVTNQLVRLGIRADDVKAAWVRLSSGSETRTPAARVEAERQPESPPAPVDWTGARPASTGVGLERRLDISDTHFPLSASRALMAILALARATQPHVIVHLGDAFNMGAVSHHPRPFGGRESHRDAQEQGVGFFRALARAAPGARKILLLGNHDIWADEYEDANPQFAGMFAAQSMGLDKLGWEVIPRSRQPFVLGPIAYAHGTGGGENFAKRYALHTAPQVDVRHIRVGHHHRCSRFHAKNGVECTSVPWLGDARHSAFDYAPDKGDWEVGALFDDVLGDHVTTTPVRIVNGTALYGGRLVAA